MNEMERLAASLPEGTGYDWTDAALEQTVAARQTPLLFALSLIAVFMALAALYESWTIPLAVLLVVPLGVIGAVAATFMRGMPNDVYFKVGMITVIGLSAKNAILIVRFARDLQTRGVPLVRAVLDAAATRFRPIVMTSFAFVLGVVPLLVSSGGAGAESRRSIGYRRVRRDDRRRRCWGWCLRRLRFMWWRGCRRGFADNAATAWAQPRKGRGAATGWEADGVVLSLTSPPSRIPAHWRGIFTAPVHADTYQSCASRSCD